MKDIDSVALLAVILFVAIPALISHLQGLGIAREIFFSSIRGTLQLVLIGYVITLIFSVESGVLLVLIILLMIMIAGKTAAKRAGVLSKAFVIASAGIFASVSVSISIWLFFGIVDFRAQYILPMGGMVIGNSMIVAGLTFERMLNELERTKGQILAKLALGASPRQACQELMQNSLKAALIPSVDQMKAMGLIIFPGMMTGAILAGASPMVAVKYQLVILLSLMSSAAITAILILFLTYRRLFKQRLF